MNTSTSLHVAVSGSNQTEAPVYVFPAAYAQRGLWVLHQLAPESAFYNLHSGIRIAASVNARALERSLNEVVRRHELMRTIFKAVDGEPVQVVRAHLEIRVPLIDLRQLGETEREDEARAIAEKHASEPFDLEQWPLLRSSLLRLGDDDYIHLLTIHHIVCDYWSMNVLLQELTTLYDAYCRGQPPGLLEPEIQYADYADWERRWLQGPAGAAHLDYWKKQLANVPALQLPTDWPRPAVSTFAGAAFHFTLPEALYRRVAHLSQEANCTLFMTMLAAFQTLLHRYTGQDDIVVGTPVANRNRFEVEGVIGHFVNSLVLRSDLSGDPPFRELLARVRVMALDAYAHQDFPFERLVHELMPERGAAHNPLFQVHFQLFSQLADDFAADAQPDALSGESFDTEAWTAKFDLALDLWEYPDGVEAHLEYCTDLFAADTIARMAAHFQLLLEQIVADPQRRLSELALMTRGERRQLLETWNDTAADYPRGLCLHQHFEAQARRTPDGVVAVFRGRQLTYDALNREANRLAYHLASLGIGPETVVAICAERSLDMLVGLLGILKAGAAYLPIDPREPQARRLHMLQEARTPLLITEQRLAAIPAPARVQRLLLDAERDRWAHCRDDNPATGVTSRNLAYVIYTSGTTGKPKGVMVESQAVCNHLLWMQAALPLTPADRVVVKYPFNFDASICEIFGPLLAGATLIISEPAEHWDVRDFVDLLEEQRVTVLDVVPSMLEALLDEKAFSTCGSLRRVTSGGEPLTTELRDRLFAQTGAALHNIYGPTEATIGATWWTCARGGADEPVMIGKPVANTQVFILDLHLHPVPIGVPGEIHIAGDGLARGYLDQPGLTAERFIRNPFSTAPARMYRTGDRARYRADGNIEYLGRLDEQVKIRGYRIEPDEVERVLVQHDAVRSCAVVAIDGEPGGHKRLATYIVPAAGEPELWPSVGEYDIYDELLYSAMTNDKVRNRAYRAAIERSVEGKAVVDVGTGADALLARFCVAAGARRVYAIEIDAIAYRSATKLIAELQLGDRIIVLRGDSKQVTLPERVDVCVSEILGTIGSSEGVVPILNDARRFLGDDGIMIPRACATWFAPVALPPNLADAPRLNPLPRTYVAEVFRKEGHCFDLRVCIKDFPRSHILAPPQEIESLDFTGPVPTAYARSAAFTIDRDARLDGFLCWLKLYPGDGQAVDSLNDKLSWLPVFFPALSPGTPVTNGDAVEVEWSSSLAPGSAMPDYTLRGQVLREQGTMVPFAFSSPRHTSVFRQNPFYAALLAGFDQSGIVAGGTYGIGGDAQPALERAARGLVPDLRRFARELLPHYMVPSTFVVVDELPTSVGGKVDRRALLAMARKRAGFEGTYVAPRNAVEERLACLWSEVLNVERVGVHDNFFELGGNSILTIQIVARASQAGLSLRPAQLFEHQTIAEIAGALGEAPGERSAAIASGVVLPLAPVQRALLDQLGPDHDRRHEWVVLELPRPVAFEDVCSGLDRVVTRHDALRLRVSGTGNGARQSLAKDALPTISRIDLSAVSGAKLDEAITEVGIHLGERLSLSGGRVVEAAYLDLGGSGPAQFLLAIHAFVVDEHSWRILLKDLWSACGQPSRDAEPAAPSARLSFPLWVERVATRARETAPVEEVAQGPRRSPTTLDWFPGGGVDHAASTTSIVLTLQPDETGALLDATSGTSRVRIQDVLATAVVEAFAQWRGTTNVVLGVDASARDLELDDADPSRTVGRLAVHFPVVLSAGRADGPGEALRAVKEQLRRLPARALSYCVQSGAGDDADAPGSRALPRIDVGFRFRAPLDVGGFRVLDRWDGIATPATAERRRELLEVDATIADGCLQSTWTFSPDAYGRATVETLAHGFAAALRQLVAYCSAPDASGMTPSDFANARLSQRDLDRLIAKL